MKHTSLFTLFIAVIVVAASCKKDPVYRVPVDTPVKDIQTIRLKEVIEQGLPSPYYQFVYTDSGYVSHINFADGFITYAISYKNQRIYKMVNTRFNEQLTYHYTAGNVSYITQHNALGNKTRSYAMSYNSNKKLAEVKWYVFMNNGQDSLLQRKAVLTYDAKSNIVKNEDYRLNVNNEFKLSTTTKYSDYDDGINTDDRYLLKADFGGHLLYLPQVKFQMNNPHVVTITSADTEYRIDYTYTYQNTLPVIKSGRMEQTRGSEAGKVFQFTNQYSYY
jgi:hypothetical protein